MRSTTATTPRDKPESWDVVFSRLVSASATKCCCTPPPHPTRDKPEDLGFPPVEPVAEAKPKAKDGKPKGDLWNSLLNNVLKNPFIWGMALTYFFVYVVRQVWSVVPLFDCTVPSFQLPFTSICARRSS